MPTGQSKSVFFQGPHPLSGGARTNESPAGWSKERAGNAKGSVRGGWQGPRTLGYISGPGHSTASLWNTVTEQVLGVQDLRRQWQGRWEDERPCWGKPEISVIFPEIVIGYKELAPERG